MTIASPILIAEREDYLPLNDYGVIGDTRTLALVGRDGSIDWLCLPHFASPSVFAAVLDRRIGGRFWIGTRDPDAHIRRRYLPGTPILETTFESEEGAFRVTDFFAVAGEEESRRLRPDRIIVRRIEVLDGAPEICLVCAPRPQYARAKSVPRRRGKLGWALPSRQGALLLSSDLPLELSGDGFQLACATRLRKGERRGAALSYSERDPLIVPDLAGGLDREFEETRGWWTRWSGKCRYDGPFQDEVCRSVLTLKLLTYSPSGAVMAAGTTSLPEAIGGAFNWDYRYCWLRDASLTLRAFMDLGYADEGQAFVDWLLNITRLTAPELQPLYDAFGHTRLRERKLDYLDGYRGSRPVRVGNGAHGQLQLDVYGMVSMAAFDFVERGGELRRTAKKFVAGFAKVVREKWREPDNSIWEVRGDRRDYTYSKLMCWAALDRLVALHERGAIEIDADRCRAEQDRIREAIETHAYNDALGSYVGVFGTDLLDASLLMMPRAGYIEPTNPRMTSTYETLRSRLGDGGFMRRYSDGFDAAGRAEGSFGICGFWEIDYLARAGRVDEAERFFGQWLNHANDLGLYAEEIDPRTGTALGNFPQAFTHVGLINAALAIHAAKSRPGGRQ